MAIRSTVSFPKTCLQTTPMFKSQVQGGTVRERNILHVNIEKFSQMIPNVAYYGLVGEFEWELIVCKKAKVVSLCLVTDKHLEITECYVCYADSEISKPAYVEKETYCTIEVHFPYSIIHDCRNTALEKGALYLLFKCDVVKELVKAISPFTGIKIFKNNDTVTTTSRNLNFWDFVIYLSDGELKAHKAVLATRSKFFNKYILENKGKGEIRLSDASCNACAHVLNFLYFANMKISAFDVMMQVLEMAVRLEIKSLEHLCSTHMVERMDGTTCYLVKSLGRRLGLEKLVKIADYFISRNKGNEIKLNLH